MVVIAVAAAIVVGCIVGFSNGAPSNLSEQEGFTLDDILYGKYGAKDFNGSWISDTEILYEDTENLVIYNVVYQNKTPLVPVSLIEEKNMNSLWLSKDRLFLLFSFEETKVWRHSTKAKYSVLDIPNNYAEYPITIEGVAEQPQLQFASFSTTNNSIVFVFENNIYYKEDPVDDTVVKITTDGSDSVFNGVPDWVYEEEILSKDNAIWFSPKSTKFAYATFHDDKVKTFDFPYYGTPGDLNSQYPRNVAIRYPKAGTINPIARLVVANMTTLSREGVVAKQEFVAPSEMPADNYILTTATWASDEKFFVIWSNRVQNESYFTMCIANTGKCHVIYEHKTAGGWNEFFKPPTFNPYGTKFVIIYPVDVPASDDFQSGKYKHVVLFERTDSGNAWNKRVLTNGHFEMTEILSWDVAKKRVYAIGTAVGKPSERHLYSIDVARNSSTCVTCDTRCTWNSVKMSDDSSYYSHNCAGPGVPEIRLNTAKTHTSILDWELNPELQESLQSAVVPKYEYRTNIQIGGANSSYKVNVKLIQNHTSILDMQLNNGQQILQSVVPSKYLNRASIQTDGAKSTYKANVKLIMPPDYNPSNPGAKKYPVVVHVYGAPSSQQVTEAFGFGWGHYLASHGIICALIDGRGTGFQGENFLFEIYRGMGTVEVEDQITVMKELQNEPFVDPDKTAIWGWSYGGFVTALALARDVPDAHNRTAFKCGMSVAPVTNWIYYDSIYTERYMSTPKDNESGYNRSDITRDVKNFLNKKFYLLHGTADDNVHYQNSMMLEEVLEKEDILFRSQSYPDENHNIDNLNRHVYHSLTSFLVNDCFQMEGIKI